jgi:hypothetical protein
MIMIMIMIYKYTNIQAQVRKLRLTFIRIYKQITNYTLY